MSGPPLGRGLVGVALDHLAPFVAAPEAKRLLVAGLSPGAGAVLIDEPAIALCSSAVSPRCALLGGFERDTGRGTAALAPRLALWALEEPTLAGGIPLNGFVSMHLGAGIAAIDRPGLPVTWLFGLDHPSWFGDRLAAAVGATRAAVALSGTHLALIGGIADSFFTFAVDHAAVAFRFGAIVSEHSLDSTIERTLTADPAAVAKAVRALQSAAGGRVTTNARDLELGAACYLALRDEAASIGADALAVSDWPEFQERLGIHPGMAFSWLDEHDGIPVACEGDVLGGLSMVALRALSGLGAALLDIATVHPDSGSALLWHCGGSPLHLADSAGVRWTPHSTLGRNTPGARVMGAVADLTFAPGPVTVARLDRDGRRLFAFEATVLDAADSPGPGFDGTRGWVAAFRTLGGEPRSLGQIIGSALDHAVDHHLVLTPGSHGRALAEWGRGAGVDLLPL